MRTGFKSLGMAVLLVAGLSAASWLYASESDDPGRSMMEGGGMMGMGGMMDMMRGKGGMMGMRGMMEGCPMMRRMRGDHTERPNEQWREKPSADKDNKG